MTLFAGDATATLEALGLEMKSCVACPLAEGRTQVVPGEGAVSRVVFVGHGPSGADDASGHPYSGPGGDLLDELLSQAGIGRSGVWVTNLTKCWAWKLEFGSRVNRTPGAKEVGTCVPLWLVRELEAVGPVAIVCLGGPTAQFFLGKDFKITQSRGEWLPMPEGSPYLKRAGRRLEPDPPVMAILQPAYLIHLAEHAPESYPAARQAMLRDLAEVKRVLEGGEPTRATATSPAPANPDDEAPF